MAPSPRSPDVLVIGAGVIGLSTALALRQAGLHVTVLERGAVGRGSASWAGGGILSPLEPDGLEAATLPLLRESLAAYPAWCAALQSLSGVDPEFRRCGMRVLPPVAFEAWRAFFGNGCGLQVARADEGAWLPGVAQVRNPRLLRALAIAFVRAGGVLLEQRAALGLLAQGDRVTGVRSDDGIHAAGIVVLAAGAWSASVSDEAPVRPMRGQMLLIDAAPGEIESIVLRGSRYLVPRREGPVLIGSTLEDVGFADEVTQAARDSLLASLEVMAPALARRRVLAHWSGLRPALSTGGPCIVDWATRMRGLFLNTGHYRVGITLAPGSARRAADKILSGADSR